MAIKFSRSSGLNDSLWKDIDRALMAVMQDVDNEKNKEDELVSALFTTKKSKRFGEKATGLTSFSSMMPTKEGAPAPADDLQETWPKLIEHQTFKKKFSCTREMKDDDDIDEMKTLAQNMVKAYKRSRAEWASAALVSEGANFVLYGEQVDKTTGDGEPLFSVAHKGKKRGVLDQSNVFTNAFGDGTEMLNRLGNVGRNFKNDSGQPTGYTFGKIIIPSNVPRLEDLIKRIIRSDLMVGSDFNDVNTQKNQWSLVIDHHWAAPVGKEPYIIMSDEANKELRGNVFFDRTALEVMDWVDGDTFDLMWSSYARFSAGFFNWRQVIMGGADAGSTLPAI